MDPKVIWQKILDGRMVSVAEIKGPVSEREMWCDNENKWLYIRCGPKIALFWFNGNEGLHLWDTGINISDVKRISSIKEIFVYGMKLITEEEYEVLREYSSNL